MHSATLHDYYSAAIYYLISVSNLFIDIPMWGDDHIPIPGQGLCHHAIPDVITANHLTIIDLLTVVAGHVIVIENHVINTEDHLTITGDHPTIVLDHVIGTEDHLIIVEDPMIDTEDHLTGNTVIIEPGLNCIDIITYTVHLRSTVICFFSYIKF